MVSGGAGHELFMNHVIDDGKGKAESSGRRVVAYLAIFRNDVGSGE